MTSEDIEINIGRSNGNIYNLSYHKGDRVKDLNIIGQTKETFTEIIFTLDREVWNNPHFDFEEVCQIAQGQSSLGNVIINVKDVINDITNTYQYEDGIIGYFNDLTSDKNFVSDLIRNTKTFEETFQIKDEKYTDEFDIDFIFQYSNDSNEDIQKDFLNTADLIQHGTIQEGVILGLKNSIHKWLKDNGKYNKNEKNITLDDVSTGLNYICNVKNKIVEYQNQTKQKTEADYYKPILQKFIQEYMEIFFIENKEQSEKICNQVLLNSRVRTKSDIARRDARKQLEEKADSINTRPNKFVPCRSKKPEEIVYIIIEGDGAMNSIKLARNPKTMCIQPLKGKPINPFKCKLDELLSNEEVLAMYKVWNCGIEYNGKPVKGMPKYNFNNLQVNDIIAYTDFDWDGWHIQCLLIGILYRLSPDLLKRGKFYIGITPLYVVRTQKEVEWKKEKTKELLAYSENEYSEMIKYLNDNNIKFKETRFKGLGGLPVNIMARSLNPETRILKQITMEDVENSKVLLELFLSDDGDNQQKRKEFIEEHSKDFFDYSLFIG
jgi:DNA gyrase subunit B